MTRTKKQKKTKTEKLYEELFDLTPTLPPPPKTQTLEQPTPYRAVETVTTYGAYEDPI